MRLSSGEYDALTSDFQDENGELDEKAFSSMMQFHLEEFIQRKLSDAVKYHELASETSAVLMCSKVLLLERHSTSDSALPPQHQDGGHQDNSVTRHCRAVPLDQEPWESIVPLDKQVQMCGALEKLS